jgi:hypothetical protein
VKKRNSQDIERVYVLNDVEVCLVFLVEGIGNVTKKR